RGCSTLLLQAAERVEVALSDIARAASFRELRVEGKYFVLRAPRLQRGLFGLRSLDLGQSPGGWRTNVGVIELQQELSLAHLVAFFDQQAFHGRRNRGVRFQIPNGLNFSVGGNQASDGTTLHHGSSNLQRPVVKVGVQDGHCNYNKHGPEPPPPWPWVRIVRRCQPVLSVCGRNNCKL